MASADLNIKFTNERYMTRMEVAKTLGTNLVDVIWREILLYRRGLAHDLPIYDNAHFHFTLTQTPMVLSYSESLGTKVNKYMNAFDKLIPGSIAKYTLTHDMVKSALKCIAKLNNLDISEITLQNIIEHQCNDSNYRIVINYYNALEKLSKVSYEQVSEEFLANYYAVLRGQDELTSFYRVTDSNSPSSRYLVGAEYNNGVQVHLIEDMMNSVIAFANDKAQPLLVRIIGTIFMFNYVKPFEEFNLEISILAAKAILSGAGLNESAVFIPIESILNNRDFFNEVAREVQKSKDFTYAFISGSESVIASFENIIDRIIQVNAKALESTINMGDDVKKFKEEFGFEPEKGTIEEIKPEPVVKPTPAPATKPAVHVAPAPVVSPSPASVLTDRELKNRETDILESDPYIKKGQAHFYVRHCTKGKFYTIQEYKRCEGCVYETARTSLDNLAKRGYYRREQIKNKFVYTPIDKE